MPKLTDKNRLSLVFPELVKEWHPTLNGKLTPYDVSYGSHCEVLWVCEKGHEWPAIINNRTNGNGCPYCGGKLVCNDNCLATLRPDIAAQWHPTLNGNLTPYDVTYGSGEIVWWLCEKGHEWKAKVVSRFNGGKNCKKCISLASLRPDIAKLWHPTKNGNLTPKNVTCGCDKKVWWLCNKCGHEWKAAIYEKCRGNKSCKKCISLLILRPDIAAQWHPTLNSNLTPKDITHGCGNEAWWLCEKCEKSWPANINNRTKTNGSGCPYCTGKRVYDGNCLASLFPELIKEWHPTLNKDLSPNDFTCGSNKDVWWLCSKCRNEWFIDINHRSSGSGCPKCSKNNISLISQKWLDLLKVPNTLGITREVWLTVGDIKYKVDGFDQITNTVYEFFGDYWHGNPEVYDLISVNRNNKKTFGELYEETKTRVSRLEEAGYKVIYIWERDYIKNNK